MLQEAELEVEVVLHRLVDLEALCQVQTVHSVSVVKAVTLVDTAVVVVVAITAVAVAVTKMEVTPAVVVAEDHLTVIQLIVRLLRTHRVTQQLLVTDL